MKDYTRLLPEHKQTYIGENDLFLEIFEGESTSDNKRNKPPLLFVHGAYTGSWIWSKYLPHFIREGWKCYAMNMRSHYKSRSMDMTKVSFEDYLQDIKEVVEEIYKECSASPIIIGFSMGGILCQKIAESIETAGLILIDSSVSKEVFQRVPYDLLYEDEFGSVVPAPDRDSKSIDETEEDVAFQVKYLSMESAKAFRSCGCWIKGVTGISVDSSLITCPVLVIKAVNKEEDDRRGEAEAEHLHGEYTGFLNTTHTGLLVGQRYEDVVGKILEWLHR